MKRLFGVLAMAIVVSAGMASNSDACYCGAQPDGRYAAIQRPQQCCTVMKNLPASCLSTETVHVLPHLLRTGLGAEDRHRRAFTWPKPATPMCRDGCRPVYETVERQVLLHGL